MQCHAKQALLGGGGVYGCVREGHVLTSTWHSVSSTRAVQVVELRGFHHQCVKKEKKKCDCAKDESAQ